MNRKDSEKRIRCEPDTGETAWRFARAGSGIISCCCPDTMAESRERAGRCGLFFFRRWRGQDAELKDIGYLFGSLVHGIFGIQLEAPNP